MFEFSEDSLNFSKLNDKILVGQIICYGSNTIPSKWLLCDGSAISRTTYNKLFGIIGTTYGSGNNSTTFNVPDFKGRTAIGSGTGTASDATVHSLGDMNGEETHTLTVDELAKHTHTYTRYSGSIRVAAGQVGYCWQGNGSIDSGNKGSDQPHNNMQPYTTINYIIYTGVSS